MLCLVCGVSPLEFFLDENGKPITDSTYPWMIPVRCGTCRSNTYICDGSCTNPPPPSKRKLLVSHRVCHIKVGVDETLESAPLAGSSVDATVDDRPIDSVQGSPGRASPIEEPSVDFGGAGSDSSVDDNHSTRIELDDSNPTENRVSGVVVDQVEEEKVLSKFGYPATRRFFRICLTDSGLLGAALWMIATAVAQGPVELGEGVTLNQGQLIMFLALARLVHHMGPVATQHLSAFLLSYERICTPAGYEPTHRLPFTIRAMRQQILNTTNQNSLESLLPVPSVERAPNNSAFVPAEELVLHGLMLQQPVAERIVDVRFQKLIEVYRDGGAFTPFDGIVLLYYLWMDGWDPNRSLTKLNKTPIWTATVTLIFACGRTLAVLAKKTSLAAVSPGKADHQPVLRSLLKSFGALSGETVYHEGERSVLQCVPMYLSADQPEKRNISGTYGGNSTNHPYFGCGCFFSLLPRPFGSCGRCMLDNIIGSVSETPLKTAGCPTCMDWELPPRNSMEDAWVRPKMWVYTSPVYPVDKVLPGTKYFDSFNEGAGRISHWILESVWEECYRLYVEERACTAEQVKAYFRLVCLSEATTKGFLDRCQNIRSLVDCATVPSRVSPNKRRRVIAFADQNPLLYEKPLPPIVWKYFPFHSIPETPMHLMMGVVKAVTSLVYDWAVSNNQGPDFVLTLNRCITLLHTFARMAYYPVARYGQTGTYPGWVADTCRTWWQVMPWVFDTLPESLDPVEYVLPQTSHERWNGKQCQQFLRSKGVAGVWKMKAAESKKLVEDHFALPAARRPKTVVPPGSDVTLQEIRTLSYRTHEMFRLLFLAKHTDTSKRQCRCAVKLFLSTYSSIDQRVNKADKEGYLAKFNMVSLLRAQENILDFASLRNIQEGGDDGEGLVKTMRKLTPRGLRSDFAKNLLLNFNRRQVLNFLCDTLVEANSGEEDKEFLRRQRKAAAAALVEENEARAAVDSALEFGFSDISEPHAYTTPMFGGVEAGETVWDIDEKERYKSYKSVVACTSLLSNMLPLSVVGLDGKDGLWCCVRSVRSEVRRFFRLALYLKRGARGACDGFHYYSATLATEPMDDKTGEMRITRYGLLLPHAGYFAFLGGELEMLE